MEIIYLIIVVKSILEMEIYYSKAPAYTVLQGSQINPSSRFDYLLKRTELGVDHLQHGSLVVDKHESQGIINL